MKVRSKRRITQSITVLFAFLLFLNQIYSTSNYLVAWSHVVRGSPELPNALDFNFGERFLVIEPYHGTSNRLRAYASAAALARKSQRILVVIWNPDVHANYSWTDILLEPRGVLFASPEFVSKLRASRRGLDEYDYLDSSVKGSPVNCSASTHIYVRSSFILTGFPSIVVDDINFELRNLIPSREVDHFISLLRHQVGSKPYVGVHIRMLVDQLTDIPGIDLLPVDAAAGIGLQLEAMSHRKRCNYMYFLPHITRELDRLRGSSAFVASDVPEAIQQISAEFPEGQIISTDLELIKACDGPTRRQKSCSQVAVAEFFFLSSADYILTSDWSSASELVIRLSSSPHRSGCAQEVSEKR